ncbi:molybdenum ABC transporter substrate-binding protein [Thioclava dalianensis]|uniref:Molybdenum ABC transporter substrate-binding protein n=1 Tax=Thioclava dalianensis TaxID=1185766 RepID=A0A074TDT6_9RHOB|nr:molybdate ABC transporter substrate-binding protein [Thioclava dalianensis]KEP69936.1 molybdenum ABC transporter substrate-binding protein [Thioclava dalianensis]SFN17666.1 molybdate transport system substrate-binding protein [Thioclava dalianensis]
MRFLRLAALLALSLTLALPARAGEVTIFAAASMKTALDQIAQIWQARTGDVAHVSYAGSGALARQITAGAPADIFISANPGWMESVAKTGQIKQQTDLLANSLVLIAHDPKAGPVEISDHLDLKGLLKGGKLAMALVNSVPAGEYGKAALSHYGLWRGIEPDVAQADNVRATLQLVALGAAPYGITYASDAVAEPRVHVVAKFAPDSHPPIRYPAALLTQTPTAKAFFAELRSPEATRIFKAQGFKPLQ